LPDITATVGSASANSFATEDEFDAYLETRLNVGTYTAANKQKALIEATRDLTLLSYIGERVDSTQALAWPRADAPNPDSPAIDTVYGDELSDFAEDVIPQRVKDATCELALEYLKAGTTDIASLDSTNNIQSETVGPISTSYFKPTERAQALARFPRVVNYVRPLLKGSSSGLELRRM
jgi:hypothetical protein